MSVTIIQQSFFSLTWLWLDDKRTHPSPQVWLALAWLTWLSLHTDGLQETDRSETSVRLKLPQSGCNLRGDVCTAGIRGVLVRCRLLKYLCNLSHMTVLM